MPTILNPHHVAEILGGAVTGGMQVNAPAPGHHPNDRSLSVTIDPNRLTGFRCWCHATRHPQDQDMVFDYVCRKLQDAGEYVAMWSGNPPRLQPLADSFETRVRKAVRLWDNAGPIRGSRAEDYLCSRAIDLSDELVEADALRCNDETPWQLQGRDGRPGQVVTIPCMIALVRDPLTDEPLGIHKTALDGPYVHRVGHSRVMTNGGKNKKTVGPVKGGVVKLTPHSRVRDELALSEGIEDGLTWLCYASAKIPTWAAVTAGAMKTLPVLPDVGNLTLLADADDTGQSAALACLVRWEEAGRRVRICPPPGAKDWNAYVSTGA